MISRFGRHSGAEVPQNGFKKASCSELFESVWSWERGVLLLLIGRQADQCCFVVSERECVCVFVCHSSVLEHCV